MAKSVARRPSGKIIGARMRQARYRIDQSQDWLARQLGVTVEQVQKYEQGTTRVGAARMRQVAAALRKPLSWFLRPHKASR